MNNTRYTLTFLLALLFSLGLSAQDYKSAVGVRLGYPFSLSYKTFISEASALEGYVGFRWYGAGTSWVSVNGAYQIHKDLGLEDLEGLQWYYGFGAGAQFWSYDFEDSGSTTFSLSGYLGLQYTFPESPISITFDWVPTIFIGDTYYGGFNTFGGRYGAVAVRYVLGRP